MLRQTVCWLSPSSWLKLHLFKWDDFSKPLFTSLLELEALRALSITSTGTLACRHRLQGTKRSFAALGSPQRLHPPPPPQIPRQDERSLGGCWPRAATHADHSEALWRRNTARYFCLNAVAFQWSSLLTIFLLFPFPRSTDPQPCSLCGYNNSYSSPEFHTV